MIGSWRSSSGRTMLNINDEDLVKQRMYYADKILDIDTEIARRNSERNSPDSLPKIYWWRTQ